jgi:uncharacterized lipoprotein YmbA
MIRLSIALLVVTCVGTGCASGPPARRLYVLGTPLESTEAAGNGPVVWLRRISLPEYLDSTDIVWRAGQHGLQTSPTGRWGERLSLGITQALATDLTARLPQNRVVWSDPGRNSTRELLVDVEGFDAWPDGHCVLSATWTLTDATNSAVLGGARETFTAAPARGEAQSDVRVVAGMADVLGKLADSIASAAAVRHLTRRDALDFNQ